MGIEMKPERLTELRLIGAQDEAETNGVLTGDAIEIYVLPRWEDMTAEQVLEEIGQVLDLEDPHIELTDDELEFIKSIPPSGYRQMSYTDEELQQMIADARAQWPLEALTSVELEERLERAKQPIDPSVLAGLPCGVDDSVLYQREELIEHIQELIQANRTSPVVRSMSRMIRERLEKDLTDWVTAQINERLHNNTIPEEKKS